MEPLRSETCWSTFKYWIKMCLLVSKLLCYWMTPSVYIYLEFQKKNLITVVYAVRRWPKRRYEVRCNYIGDNSTVTFAVADSAGEAWLHDFTGFALLRTYWEDSFIEWVEQQSESTSGPVVRNHRELLLVTVEHDRTETEQINPLTPNDHYSGRTAPLTSKVAFYILIQQI